LRRSCCRKHASQEGPCSCGLGRVTRLVEPVILSLLEREKARYGYEIIEQANREAVTDSEIDAAIVYRTLRRLEDAGSVTSSWQPGSSGPNRRMYEITDLGREHLRDWVTVLERHAEAVLNLVSMHKVH